MKRNNKKGFTIVELVIVIAVIAILAAVLIPTFASLVNKANIATDVALAKNLNTALAMTTDDIDTFEDVLDALREGGFLVAYLNARTEGCYFVWDEGTEQILLVDSNNEFEVLYSNKPNYSPIGDKWHLAISNKAKADAIVALNNGINIQMTIANTTDLNNSINADGENTVYIDGSLIVDDNNVIKLDNKNADVTIDLGDSHVSGGSTDASLSAIPFNNVQGKLTLKNGVINATGQFIDLDGKATDTSISSEPGTYTKIDGSVINIAINGEAGYVALYGDADVVNATITSGDCGINAGAGATVTVKDTILEANYGFFVTNSGNDMNGNKNTHLTVNGGTYKTIGNGISGYMFEVYNGEVEILEGTFNTKHEDKVFYFYNAGCSITISDGTFNGDEFSTLTTPEDWANMCKAGTGIEIDVVITNGVVTITSK